MIAHLLDDESVHFAWDNSVAPRVTIDAGDTVRFATRDAANGFYSADSVDADVLRKGPLVGHPLTGPVAVRGAMPGDILKITVLDVRPRAGFGWTAIRPGRGLLGTDQFVEPYLQIWDISDGAVARMRQRSDIAVPIACFPGIIGTALSQNGEHSTIPPRENGGNMDIRHLTRGSVLFLPVFVPGALLSVGDAHAAQGDGEVCITAIEMAGEVDLRIDVITGKSIAEPQMSVPSLPGAATAGAGYFATIASGPDLHGNARTAIGYMIDHLVRERGLSRCEAYVLCSVCVDLKINQVVDAPNWTVSAFLPEIVFV